MQNVERGTAKAVQSLKSKVQGQRHAARKRAGETAIIHIETRPMRTLLRHCFATSQSSKCGTGNERRGETGSEWQTANTRPVNWAAKCEQRGEMGAASRGFAALIPGLWTARGPPAFAKGSRLRPSDYAVTSRRGKQAGRRNSTLAPGLWTARGAHLSAIALHSLGGAGAAALA